MDFKSALFGGPSDSLRITFVIDTRSFNPSDRIWASLWEPNSHFTELPKHYSRNHWTRERDNLSSMMQASRIMYDH